MEQAPATQASETPKAKPRRPGDVVPADHPSEGTALAASRPRQALTIFADPELSQHQQLANASLSAVTLGGVSARAWTQKGMGEIGLNEAVAFVQERADEAANGDLAAAKRMLMAQATALDSIFHEMARKAASVLKNNEDGSWSFNGSTMECVMRVAFKSQAQCRATLQTLGELVNPRSVAFIKADQANVANGHQQVNNGGPAPRTGENGSPSNKLLEDSPSERLDTRAPSAAGGANQALEAVGAVHGAKVGGRQGRSRGKRDKARAA